VVSATWLHECRIAILTESLQDTVGVSHLLPAQSGVHSVQDSQLKVSLRPGSSVVERGPEKAGVGGSIPSLATI
jgi:hypothetical protein